MLVGSKVRAVLSTPFTTVRVLRWQLSLGKTSMRIWQIRWSRIKRANSSITTSWLCQESMTPVGSIAHPNSMSKKCYISARCKMGAETSHRRARTSTVAITTATVKSSITMKISCRISDTCCQCRRKRKASMVKSLQAITRLHKIQQASMALVLDKTMLNKAQITIKSNLAETSIREPRACFTKPLKYLRQRMVRSN